MLYLSQPIDAALTDKILAISFPLTSLCPLSKEGIQGENWLIQTNFDKHLGMEAETQEDALMWVGMWPVRWRVCLFSREMEKEEGYVGWSPQKGRRPPARWLEHPKPKHTHQMLSEAPRGRKCHASIWVFGEISEDGGLYELQHRWTSKIWWC